MQFGDGVVSFARSSQFGDGVDPYANRPRPSAMFAWGAPVPLCSRNERSVKNRHLILSRRPRFLLRAPFASPFQSGGGGWAPPLIASVPSNLGTGSFRLRIFPAFQLRPNQLRPQPRFVNLPRLFSRASINPPPELSCESSPDWPLLQPRRPHLWSCGLAAFELTRSPAAFPVVAPCRARPKPQLALFSVGRCGSRLKSRARWAVASCG